MTFPLTAVFAFTVGAVYDALNVGFIHASEKGRPVRAGIFSVLVGACAFFGFREAFENIWTLPFLLAGYFVGTYWAVRMKGKKPKSTEARRAEREDRLRKLGYNHDYITLTFIDKYDRYINGGITYEELYDPEVQ